MGLKLLRRRAATEQLVWLAHDAVLTSLYLNAQRLASFHISSLRLTFLAPPDRVGTPRELDVNYVLFD